MESKSIIILLTIPVLLRMKIDAQIFKAGAAIRIITPENLIPISGGMGTPVIPNR